MIDALVGVVIIGLMMSVALLSFGLARRLSSQAQSVHQAQLTLSALILTIPHRPGVYTGARDGLNYTISVSEAPVRDVVLCRFHAEILDASNHRHDLDGTRWCEARIP